MQLIIYFEGGRGTNLDSGERIWIMVVEMVAQNLADVYVSLSEVPLPISYTDKYWHEKLSEINFLTQIGLRIF